jgi:hypothetical protein
MAKGALGMGVGMAKSAATSLTGKLKELGTEIMRGVVGTSLASRVARGEKLGFKAASLGFGVGMLATGSVSGGFMGAAAGFAPVSRRTRQGLQRLTSIATWGARRSGRYPIITGTALTMGAAGTGILMGSLEPRPLPTVGAVTQGRGYVSWTPGRSGGMSPNHLGATGGLALALHNSRHKINPKSLNLA